MPKLLRDMGITLLVLIYVLLADAAVAFVALLFLMGEKYDGDYSGQHRLINGILTAYLLFLIGLGLYWKAKQQRFPLLIGLLLGTMPVGGLLIYFLLHPDP